MPGLKKSPGLADIEVCSGAHRAGSSALNEACRKSKRAYGGTPRLKTNSMDFNRYPEYPTDMRRSFPAAGAWPESSSEESDTAETPVHEGFENRITTPPQAKSLVFEESGLPPTPPTLSNSDDSQEVAQHERSISPPAFADGVRNALSSKKSGQSVTPVNAGSPPTPDPSPPATTIEPPPMAQKGKPDFLQPLIESASAHMLRPELSSRAESFQTAREDLPQNSKTSLTSPVYIPEDDKLPEHWLDSTRELELATAGLGSMNVADTPKERKLVEDDKSVTPKTSRRRRISKHESPPQTSHAAHADTDWEKHISYVSGPDELDKYQALGDGLNAQEAAKEPKDENVKGLGLSGAGLQEEDIPRSAEDVNNMVYKRIREENVKRHSVVSSGSGAITVGIILPSDSTPKTLKRQTKCLSLRDGSTSASASKRNSLIESPDSRMVAPRKIRGPVERTRKLDASPELQSSIRQVSSPARLGPDPSNMTALTYASLQDSPSAKKGSFRGMRPETEHKLRHFTHGARLSNNPSVRRTSLQGSPTLPNRGFEIHREPEYSARRRSGAERAVSDNLTNVGIKRSSTADGARPSRLVEKPRGVIPSVVSDTDDDMLERSPTTGRLRRFSREERLENNDAVRRTSLGHEQATKLASDLTRALESEKNGVASPPPERTSLQLSDRGLLPSSPRKSMDARLLHPTSTPMSTSQFSDRTEMEVCEASGVRIYPHNNDSLLVVQHGSRPVSKDKSSSPRGHDPMEDHLKGIGKPIFAAQVDPPTPVLHNYDPVNVDSPLINPRTAPEPPQFNFIPPTPSEELDRTMSNEEREDGTLRAEVNLPRRRLTLLQRARRYSDSLFFRTGSLRRPRRPVEERDVYLSPMWRPVGFWHEDYDSEDEDDFEPAGSLPRGGDTSDVVEDEQRRGLFPRAMSKRLPGFRGTGGFLQGNSLGLDRHGTNNRRHYVSTGTRTLSKRQSEELLRNIAARNPDGRPSSAPPENMRRLAKVKAIAVPFSGGKRGQLIGTKRLRAKIKAKRLAREEKAAEKRRERLRESIGPRVVHGDGMGNAN